MAFHLCQQQQEFKLSKTTACRGSRRRETHSTLSHPSLLTVSLLTHPHCHTPHPSLSSTSLLTVPHLSPHCPTPHPLLSHPSLLTVPPLTPHCPTSHPTPHPVTHYLNLTVTSSYTSCHIHSMASATHRNTPEAQIQTEYLQRLSASW